MKTPAIGDKILLVTNTPNDHDYLELELIAIEADGTLYGIEPGQDSKDARLIDLSAHISGRMLGSDPQAGDWSYGNPEFDG